MQRQMGSTAHPLPFCCYSDATSSITIGEGVCLHPLNIYLPYGAGTTYAKHYAMRTIAMLPTINLKKLRLPPSLRKTHRYVCGDLVPVLGLLATALTSLVAWNHLQRQVVTVRLHAACWQCL